MRIAEFTRHLLMPLAIIGLIPVAWAATPVAVWEGDFSQTCEGYTLNLNDNAVADGAVTIGGKGVLVSWTDSTNPFGTNQDNTKVQVLVKYSNFPIPQEANKGAVMVSLSNNARDQDYLGTCIINNGEPRGIWTPGNVYDGHNKGDRVAISTTESISRFVASYTRNTTAIPGTSVTYEGTMAYVGDRIGYGATGLKANYTVGDICVGGKFSSSNLLPATGMKIYGIAVFNTLSSPTELAAYKFPSEVSDFTAAGVSGTVDWSEISFAEGSWRNSDTSAATLTLTGDAVITIPDGFQANKIVFSGAHDVKLVSSANINVNAIALENGATLSERPVTVFEAASTIAVPANTTYVTYGDITANASVAAEGTLKIATGTATIGGAAQDLKGTLTVERGATFKTTVSDWPSYNNGSTVNVFGTLDLNNRRWTMKKINPINLHTGGRIVMAEGGSTDGGCSINAFDANNEVFELTVVKDEGCDSAECAATIGPQAHATINVPAGATLVLSSPVSSSVSGRLGAVEKIGDGALEISGDINTLEGLAVTAGSVAFVDGAVAPRAITGAYTIASGTLEVASASIGGATVKAGATLVIPVDNATLTAGTTVTVTAVETDGQVQFKDPSGALFTGTVTGNQVELAPLVYTFTGNGAWSDVANWDGGRKPGNGNAAVITGAVTIDEAVSVAGLTGTGSIAIPADATLVYTGSANIGPTVSGAGTLRLEGNSGEDIPSVSGLTTESWSGVVELRNLLNKKRMKFTDLGHTGTEIVCQGVQGWFNATPVQTIAAKVTLVTDATVGFALNIRDGSSRDENVVTFTELSGAGKLLANGGSTAGFLIQKWDAFTGSVEVSNKTISFGTVKKADQNKIIINRDAEVTIAEGATWTANGGIQVDGTLVVAGTTTYDNFTPQTATHGTVGSQVYGAGEVVYLGALPADAATAMYTNEVAWTGTVTLKNFGELDSRTGIPNSNHVRATLPGKAVVESWQNANSRIKFQGVKAWTPNNVTYAINLVLEDQVAENGETIYAWHNDSGGSGNTTTIQKISGAGTFYDNAACSHVLKFTDASDFTGAFDIQGKLVCLGASTTLPANGGIRVSSAIAAAGQTWTAPGGVTLEDGSSIVYQGGTLTTSVSPTLAGTITVGLADGVAIPADGAKVLVWTAKPADVTFEKGKSLPEKSRVVAKADGLYLTQIMPFILSIQ